MRFVYLLEDDPKFQKEIIEAILFIDPKIQVRVFNQLENFVNWFRGMMTTGPAAIAKGGNIPEGFTFEPVNQEAHQLVMVISKIEFLGAEQLGLLRKTRDLFVQRKICTHEDPTSFVLTAFDDPNFKIKDLEDRILNNVLFKPFDRLILVQDLTFAIDGRHPASKYTITNQKTSAVVEMLKDVQLEAFSEIGFLTMSDRKIEKGSIAKYYGSLFQSDRHRSIMGVAQECLPHPKLTDRFLCVFTFLAADPTQIANLRKKSREKQRKEYPYEWSRISRSPSEEIHIITIDEEESQASGLFSQLPKRFNGLKVHNYVSYAAFQSDLEPELAMKNKDSTLKAFSVGTEATLNFDLAGNAFLGVDIAAKDVIKVFGVPEANLKTKGNWFQNAMPTEQREKFRQYIANPKKDPTLDTVFSIQVESHTFLIKALSVTKDAKRIQVKFTELSNPEQIEWYKKNSKIPQHVHALMISDKYFKEDGPKWVEIKEKIQKKAGGKMPLLFMLSKKDFTDAQEREYGAYVDDILFKPVDRAYAFQKIKSYFPRLKDTSEPVEIHCVEIDDVIKTANPVKVTELSEAGFVMQYHRPISLGSFREIVLWQPYEIGSPEYLATCNYAEETQKGVFSNHFVFFGVSDFFLKHIRVWIRDNYILSKEGQQS